jgi:serine/threonine protein kinase
MAGQRDTGEEETYFKMQERRKIRKEAQRTKLGHLHMGQGQVDHWNMEHGDDMMDPEGPPLSRQSTHNSQQSLSYKSGPRSGQASRIQSRATSRAPSGANSRSHTPLPVEYDMPALDSDNEDDVPGPLPSIGSNQSNHGSSAALDGMKFGSYPDDPTGFRGRSPSMADSTTSFMSLGGEDLLHSDSFDEEYSFVPTLTLDQAQQAFRETLLGLEYLHYEGIVHRDIKPANLLMSQDRHVKISDFGVSYFGRPIREGEVEENVSEADATDFDDDKELAKTVGTPAFFAPELCYTNTDKEQPKVTEQIDVWSFGVTLYALIYGRLPFLAENEYELWNVIANDDVHISRKRLKAVGPTLPLNGQTQPPSPYRAAGELAYDNVDIDLHDLLRRMLVKDPLERIKLREVKRHPWTLKGMDNFMGWIDDTDPSRKTAGRRIQVDKTELDHAVVPITFLERARSALRKTAKQALTLATNVVKPGSDTRSDGSRRRAISSATSSGTDNLHMPYTPSTPVRGGIREYRRASLRGDEQYFASVSDLHEPERPFEHPLSQSLAASPEPSSNGDDPFGLDRAPNPSSVVTPMRVHSSSSIDTRPGAPDRTVSEAASIQTVVYRGHSRTAGGALADTIREEDFPYSGYFTDHLGNVFDGRLTRAPNSNDKGASRTKSVDRGVFAQDNKHGEPSVATSMTNAPGHIESSSVSPTPHSRPLGSAQSSQTNLNYDQPPASPMFFHPHIIQMAAGSQSSSSSPNFSKTVYSADSLDQRPATANRTSDAKTPPPRVYKPSTPESFEQAQRVLDRRRMIEEKAYLEQSRKGSPMTASRCPPSPDDLVSARRQEATGRAQSSSSVNTNSIPSQVTSPDVASPISSLNPLGSQEKLFPSVPSLPALVSSGSSVCADLEGEFLQHPGVVPVQAPLSSDSTPETLTPPSLSKQVSLEGEASDTVSEEGYNGDGDMMTINDDDSSDSDEGLTMGARKRRPVSSSMMPRRGTNASVGSTETAKKVVMDR